MKWLAFVIILHSTLLGAQPIAADQMKANVLLDSGIKHFNAGDYKSALGEFHDSYDLAPSLLAAAYSAHAQANVDPNHATAVLEWIGKGLNGSPSADAVTWAELAHACRAAQAAAHGVEDARSQLQSTNADLTKANADLTAKILLLQHQVSTYESVWSSLKASVPTKEWDRLNKQICDSGRC